MLKKKKKNAELFCRFFVVWNRVKDRIEMRSITETRRERKKKWLISGENVHAKNQENVKERDSKKDVKVKKRVGRKKVKKKSEEIFIFWTKRTSRTHRKTQGVFGISQNSVKAKHAGEDNHHHQWLHKTSSWRVFCSLPPLSCSSLFSGASLKVLLFGIRIVIHSNDRWRDDKTLK